MQYSIRTREFIPEDNHYSWWITEFQNIKSMESAVKCARAHFVLLNSYGKIDKDIADCVEKMCDVWLELSEGERPNRISIRWEKRFQLVIGIPE